jgi:hypothetical protein
VSSRTFLGTIACAIAMSGALRSGPAHAAEPPADLQTRMSGRYELAEPKATVDARMQQAIEQSVAPMNFLIRPIARSRLGQVVVYCDRYELGLDAERVRVKCDARPPIERKLDNSEGKVSGLDAEPVQIKVSIESDAVALAFETEQGMRTTTYRFDASGGMELRVSVISSQLEKPIEWAIHYRRADSAPRTSSARP